MSGAASGRTALPDEAYTVALLTLPGLSPTRLAVLLGQRQAGDDPAVTRPGDPVVPPLFPLDVPKAVGPTRSAAEVWSFVLAGRALQQATAGGPGGRLGRGGRGGRGGPGATRDDDPEVTAARWAAMAARLDVVDLWERYRRLDIVVDLLGTDSYPSQLASDREAPYVLFRRGRQWPLDGHRVAIVGTRRCTPAGREIAREFGQALAAAGVRVVSGLALGIDGAAHQGAMEGGAGRADGAPIGVVAGGFDLPYPARHRTLWRDVVERGVLVSEWPLGTPSEGWRFPARNRIIAGLADAVVVIESQERGGSMITANAALERGVSVLAVPGSIRNPAAAGTNQLLRDGAAPVCGIEDVFDALSLDSPAPPAKGDGRTPPGATAERLLAVMGWEPIRLDVLMAHSTLDPSTIALELAHLELAGWVAERAGYWHRIGPPPR